MIVVDVRGDVGRLGLARSGAGVAIAPDHEQDGQEVTDLYDDGADKRLDKHGPYGSGEPVYGNGECRQGEQHATEKQNKRHDYLTIIMTKIDADWTHIRIR